MVSNLLLQADALLLEASCLKLKTNFLVGVFVKN